MDFEDASFEMVLDKGMLDVFACTQGSTADKVRARRSDARAAI